VLPVLRVRESGYGLARLALIEHEVIKGHDVGLVAFKLETHRAHLVDLEAAVRSRVATGSIEPVMIREVDLRRLSDPESTPMDRVPA
jgi:hypothetical protein